MYVLPFGKGRSRLLVHLASLMHLMVAFLHEFYMWLRSYMDHKESPVVRYLLVLDQKQEKKLIGMSAVLRSVVEPPTLSPTAALSSRLPSSHTPTSKLSSLCSLSVETNGFCKLPKHTLPVMAV